jgi:glyoxylase I family protein
MKPPFWIDEIDHVVIRCRDQARSLEFYTRVLGLAEERRIDAIGLIQLRAGQAMVDLVPAEPPPTNEGRNVDHVCLGIDATDMDAVIRYLRANGVDILGDPRSGTARAAWARRSTSSIPTATSSS